jgi:RNA polymerase sigma-70 factor (ECF subfamily)
MADRVPTTMPEAVLVERARGGSSDALAALVARHNEVAFRAAYLVTHDADEAADATQQGFIRAYDALGRFRRGSPFRPWLLRIVTNQARNLRRAERARAQLALRLEPPGDVPPPETTVLADERRRDLLAALERASDDDRLVITYRYFLELDESEMAAALDCPRGTVKSRLSRALARLRTILVEESPLTGPPR